MKKRIRYTPEQKKKMKQKALNLLSQGKSQKAVAAELGTTITTLNTLFKGETYPGQRRKSSKVKGKLGLDSSNPVTQLAAKCRRLEDIGRAKQALEAEEQQLKEEMKALYDALGQTIFG